MIPSDLRVTHRFVQVGQLRVHCVEQGSGPLVLLLHGFPESWWTWRYQFDALAAAGFRVVAPDQRGYGETDKQGPYDLDTLALDVRELCRVLQPERPTLIVGHDWGGIVAWHLAGTHPDAVSRVALLNCPHPEAMRRALLARPRVSQLARSWYIFFFQLPWLPEFILTRRGAGEVVKQIRGSAVDRSHFSAEELQPFRDAALQPGAARAMVGWYRTAAKSAFRSLLSPPAPPTIHAPVLLLWGDADRALSYDEIVPGTSAWAPNLEIVRVPGCGHFIAAERPDVVNEKLVQFLKAPSVPAAPASAPPSPAP